MYLGGFVALRRTFKVGLYASKLELGGALCKGSLCEGGGGDECGSE